MFSQASQFKYPECSLCCLRNTTGMSYNLNMRFQQTICIITIYFTTIIQFIHRFIYKIYGNIPFCRVAVRCSPSNCFSTVAMSGFLRETKSMSDQRVFIQCLIANLILEADTHCVLWSRYVMTLSASSSKRLFTWWRYSGTWKTKQKKKTKEKKNHQLKFDSYHTALQELKINFNKEQ